MFMRALLLATAILAVPFSARGQTTGTIDISSLPPATGVTAGTLFPCENSPGATDACSFQQMLEALGAPVEDTQGGINVPIGTSTPAAGTFTGLTVNGTLTFGPEGLLDVANTPIEVNGVTQMLGTFLSQLKTSPAAGAPGKAGSSVMFGAGTPSPLTGNVGDTYVNEANGQLYTKSSGLWAPTSYSIIGPQGVPGVQGTQGAIGPAGPQGVAGAPGANALSGSAAPASTTGNNGDTYLETGTGELFKKAAGAWTDTGLSLIGPKGIQGPQGVPGATGAVGTPGAKGIQGLQGVPGTPGVQGAPGQTGPTGPAGATGAPGSNVLSGSAAPASTTGNNGDTYLETGTGEVFKKAAGAWTDTQLTLKGAPGAAGAQGVAGPVGPAGSPGASGATGAAGANVLTGTGAPAMSTGANGDSFVNLANGEVFKKAAGAWTDTQLTLKGAAGAPGAQGIAGPAGTTGPQGVPGATGAAGAAGSNVLTGTINPVPQIGNNGDSFVDVVNGEVWKRAGGTWTDTGNSLKGSTGAPGAPGAAGAQGVQGPQGVAGATGATGTAGANVLQGPSAPATSIGANGDSYVETSNGEVWKKAAGTWTDTGASLKGPVGAQGLPGPPGTAGAQGAAGAPGSQGLQGLQGVPGSTGATGPAGPAGPAGLTGLAGANVLTGGATPASTTGSNGDTYFQTGTGEVFKKSAGAWTDTGASLKGPQGVAGTTGPAGVAGPQGLQGAAGASVLSGSPAPTASVGNNGDTYLEASTGEVWKKAAGAWADTGLSLMGHAGAAGATGSTGAQGIQGVPGSTGPAGSPGTPGANVFTGSGAPGGNIGSAGDSYVDITTGNVYRNVTGTWNPTGYSLQGASIRGSNVLTGASTPTTAVGNNGDSYIDLANGEAYQKASGAWSDSGFSVAGANVLSGSATPTAATGNNGDTFINATNGEVYKKTAGAWIDTCLSIMGAAGGAGAAGQSTSVGTSVPSSTSGNNGDSFILSGTGEVYQKASGSWTDTGATLKGLTGANFLSGTAAPASTAGNNGDTFINVTTGEVYQKSAGAWVDTCVSLMGPTGATGATGAQGTAGAAGATGATGATGAQGATGSTGATGAAGTAGANFLSGTTTPASATGNNGDSYINLTTGEVYKKASGAWSDTGQTLRAGLTVDALGSLSQTGPAQIQNARSATNLFWEGEVYGTLSAAGTMVLTATGGVPTFGSTTINDTTAAHLASGSTTLIVTSGAVFTAGELLVDTTSSGKSQATVASVSTNTVTLAAPGLTGAVVNGDTIVADVPATSRINAGAGAVDGELHVLDLACEGGAAAAPYPTRYTVEARAEYTNSTIEETAQTVPLSTTGSAGAYTLPSGDTVTIGRAALYSGAPTVTVTGAAGRTCHGHVTYVTLP